MSNFFVACFMAIACFSALCQTQRLGEVQPPTQPQYYPGVKCTFPIFGQFDYEQAKSACATRDATLAFFAHPSEERSVRQAIDWKLLPGFAPPADISSMSSQSYSHSSMLAMMMRMKGGDMGDKKWIGQLWIAVKRLPNADQWYFDAPRLPQMPISWAPLIANDTNRNNRDIQCVVAREDGWVPMNCSSIQNGKQNYIGALCTVQTVFPPNSDVVAVSNNYCGTNLVPASTSYVALPMVARKTFFLVRGQFTFEQSEGVCNSYRARMATSRSIEEFDFIPKNVNFPSVGGRAWMNLRRVSSASTTFIWNDGAVNILEDAWLPGQPDQSGDCAAFEQQAATSQPGWRVYPCSQQMSVLCETFMVL